MERNVYVWCIHKNPIDYPLGTFAARLHCNGELTDTLLIDLTLEGLREAIQGSGINNGAPLVKMMPTEMDSKTLLETWL